MPSPDSTSGTASNLDIGTRIAARGMHTRPLGTAPTFCPPDDLTPVFLRTLICAILTPRPKLPNIRPLRCVESFLRTRSLEPTGALQRLHKARVWKGPPTCKHFPPVDWSRSFGALAMM